MSVLRVSRGCAPGAASIPDAFSHLRHHLEPVPDPPPEERVGEAEFRAAARAHGPQDALRDERRARTGAVDDVPNPKVSKAYEIVSWRSPTATA